MSDAVVIVATIGAFEIIELPLGRAVAIAVAVTVLIACIAFLYHAGKKSA
jgi:hypothetical protein